jgi:hypothetical protein
MTLKNKKTIERLLKSFGQLKDESFDFDLITKYFRNKDNSEAFQILSDKTCNDLDFEELFMYVDRTNSKVGQQYLYNKLRVIPSKTDHTKKEEELINTFKNNHDFRIAVQFQLDKLNKYETYYIPSLFQEEHLKPPKWFFIIPFLSFTNALSLILLIFNFQFIYILVAVFLINIVIHYWNKRNLYQYIGSLPQLLKLHDVAKELFKNDALKKLNQDLIESIIVLDKIKNRMSFFKLEQKLDNDLSALIWGLYEFFKTFFLLEPLLLFGVLKQLNTKKNEIEGVFSFVGKIDSLISISSLRNGLSKYCIPEIILDNKRISAKNVYHPLIQNCIKNNINIDKKSILLTGSNMSGKTSFIRTIGINVIAGLTINTCFAEQFSMPKMRIFSAIRISDDLMNDISYYFEEVLTIKEMIDKSIDGKPNLFLLDEIFKGTNTIERISAGKAVLSFLSKANNIVFVSTHDIELADLLIMEYDLYHFSEIINQKTIDFDYMLKNGKLKNRNAIKILQINDYPDGIIKEAIDLSEELDKISLVSSTNIL